MAIVNISEAARLVKKSRTTLYRYIKDGKLSICTGHNNEDGVDTSELIRVFGILYGTPNEQAKVNMNEHSVTFKEAQSEQLLLQETLIKQEYEIKNLQQKIEFLETLLEEKNSMVLEKEKRLLLLEYKNTEENNHQSWITRLFHLNK